MQPEVIAQLGMKPESEDAVVANRDGSTVIRGDHLYVAGTFESPATYEALREKLEEIDRTRATRGNRIFYLATPPNEFAAVNARGAGPLVLRSIEMDLTPEGASDMDAGALARLDLVLGAGTAYAAVIRGNGEVI